MGRRRRRRVELRRRAAVLQKERRTHAEFGDPDRCVGAQRLRTSWRVCPLASAEGRAGIRDRGHGDRDQARRLQRPRSWRSGRDGVARADHDQRWQKVEHVPCVPRRWDCKSREPENHRRSDRDSGRPRRFPRTFASDGRRVPIRRPRSPDRDCGDRGDPERGSDRLPPSPDAVWRRAAEGAWTSGRPVPSSFPARRQAFEGSLADPSVLPRTPLRG